MSAIDRAEVEKAITNLLEWFAQNYSGTTAYPPLETVLAAARAHLDTLPKTRKTWRWHVEWCEILSGLGQSILCVAADHHNDYSAKVAAEALKLDKKNVCIHVTGPHEHEIPA